MLWGTSGYLFRTNSSSCFFSLFLFLSDASFKPIAVMIAMNIKMDMIVLISSVFLSFLHAKIVRHRMAKITAIDSAFFEFLMLLFVFLFDLFTVRILSKKSIIFLKLFVFLQSADFAHRYTIFGVFHALHFLFAPFFAEGHTWRESIIEHALACIRH